MRMPLCGSDSFMVRIVGLQVVATALVAAVSWLISGRMAAVSAGLGGAACFVPNALFALRLSWAARKPGCSGPVTFLVGEFVKLGLTLALLVWMARAVQDLVWPAAIIAIIVCLKSYLLIFWLDQHRYT